ncbi:MAG TPA: ribose-5-phosphate isomerase RpiA [Alphaproteobacteria bacterium]|nr:ribose-5-phosphate isomerase RpiA [Alphaproteobacteria bacterium]
MTDAASRDELKKAAARAAADLVEDGMVIGLGTGTTAAFLVALLGARVRGGLKIIGIPTSERTAAQAVQEGIPLATFADYQRIDLTIDGADEILPGTLDLIKGAGGALLREKIVAAASSRMAVISDDSKLVQRLGSVFAVPVEIVPFGWEATASRLRDRADEVRLRLVPGGGAPYVTDGGHYIVDCRFAAIPDPAGLERELSQMVGVVESGLFVGLATEALIAEPDGVRRLMRS